jgi:HEAT repeat protein
MEVMAQAADDAVGDAITALHWRGSREVLNLAVLLTQSANPILRGRGAEILGQLGVPDRTFPDECFAAVLPLLADDEGLVVCDAIYALQHINDFRAAPYIIPLADHEDDDIRHNVAVGLAAVDTREAESVLLRLMNDRDADVRNWATFGIGQQRDSDTDEIRSAFAAAVLDDDPEVRYEGIIGLGRRRDIRAVRYLKFLLHDDPDNFFARDAAVKLLGLDDREQVATIDLLGALQRLQCWHVAKNRA